MCVWYVWYYMIVRYYFASIVHCVIQSVSSISVSFCGVFACVPGPSLARERELAHYFLGNALEHAWVAVLYEMWAVLLEERVEVCFQHYPVTLGCCACLITSSGCQDRCSMSRKWQRWAGLSPVSQRWVTSQGILVELQTGSIWEAR